MNDATINGAVLNGTDASAATTPPAKPAWATVRPRHPAKAKVEPHKATPS